MKLTLDTNCLINHFDHESATATSRDEIAQLIRYATSGRAEVVITTRAEADLNQDKNDERRERLKRTLAMFKIIPSVLRWDESSWDGGDVWADNNAGVLADEIQKVLFPALSSESNNFGNKIRDVDHITAHAMDRRDIFVTDDGRLNQRAGELEKLGVVVMRPAECVAYIERIDKRAKPETLTGSSNPEYQNVSLSGVVSFDYSNNDGRFVIGEGHFLFETKWSKASDVSIHAYGDMASVEGIALAQGAARIADVTDAASYDYSSRARTPQIGQVILWQNSNGVFAATQILKVADDTRGANRDELSFEFRILTEGTSFA
jgi:hypothetical protein